MVIMDTERLKARISHVLETGTPLVESAVDIALRRQFKIALGLGSLAIVGLFCFLGFDCLGYLASFS